MNSFVWKIVIVLSLYLRSVAVFSANQMDQYNIVWTEQSTDSSESMPVGGHSIGLNLWVENGEILFYVQRSGCFNENNEYLKLGRVRLNLTPNPFRKGASFKQELKLSEGYGEITGKVDDLKTTVAVWVEAHRPVVHVDVESTQTTTVEAAYEGWRNEDVLLPDDNKGGRFGCFSYEGYPGDVIRHKDTVLHEDHSVLFYHRNKDENLLFDIAVKQQGLEGVKSEMVNTQKGRTFGGRLTGEGFVADGVSNGIYQNTRYKSWRLRSESSSKQHQLQLFTHVEQTETLASWLSGLNTVVNEKMDRLTARQQTLNWWQAFWKRSHLIIDPSQGRSTQSTAWKLGRNYQLFRYQLGCNAMGTYPTKFNGGNFTFDPLLVNSKRLNGKSTKTLTPDWRAWGGGSFTAQNQRLVYWPMLKTGDFALMQSQFEFYNRMLPAGEARVKTYWGHKGAFFCEQTENFGLPIACAWGWENPGIKMRARPADTEHGVLPNKSIGYHYESQLEFSYMMLEYHRYTGADISQYMEFIKASVLFFDEHYQMRQHERTGQFLDENGKLVIFPSTACETYKEAKNPGDVIAGLRACITDLIELDQQYVSSSEKTFYRSYLERLPDYSYDSIEGDTIIKPAESWEAVRNVECPQFYPLFPFNQFSLARDDMSIFRNTWKHGTFKKDMVISWHQDGIFFARMGMTDAAKDYNTRKMIDGNHRFPTFWGPGHDWTPDHNWGGSGMIGLQEMLMQTIGNKIHLMPAWPRDWDVDFQLHAPQQTIVEGRIRNGEVLDLKITPKSRAKDVIIGLP